MYFLERKETVFMPNILGNTSQPVPTYRWKAIYTCPEKWPLQAMMKGLDSSKYRITSNNPEEEL